MSCESKWEFQIFTFHSFRVHHQWWQEKAVVGIKRNCLRKISFKCNITNVFFFVAVSFTGTLNIVRFHSNTVWFEKQVVNGDFFHFATVRVYCMIMCDMTLTAHDWHYLYFILLAVPKTIIYDNACNLHSYFLNREPVSIRSTRFVVDGLHWKNHTCSSAYNSKQYPNLMSVNTHIVEQANSTLKKLRTQISYMTPDQFVQHLALFILKWTEEASTHWFDFAW